MNHDKSKKYKGTKFLKVEPQQFNNATRFNQKSKNNSSSINDLISLNENKRHKFNLNSFIENSLKIEKDKTLVNKNKIININSINSMPKKYSSIKIKSQRKLFFSPYKLKSRKINELGLIKKSLFNNEDILVSLFSKDKIKPLKLKKNVSSRYLFSGKNIFSNKNLFSNKNIFSNKNQYSTKTIIINNIEPKNNNNKKKSDKNINNKSKNNDNDIKNNENENNTNYCENTCVDKNKKENISENEKNQKNKEDTKCYKHFFCCLYK